MKKKLLFPHVSCLPCYCYASFLQLCHSFSLEAEGLLLSYRKLENILFLLNKELHSPSNLTLAYLGQSVPEKRLAADSSFFQTADTAKRAKTAVTIRNSF
jgi:hypothetical protein